MSRFLILWGTARHGELLASDARSRTVDIDPTPTSQARRAASSRRTLTLIVALVVVVVSALWLNGLRNRADVIEAFRSEPGAVALTVGSCNRQPFVDEFEQTEPGTYEVLVRTQLANNGEDCADGLTIEVDPEQPMVVIVDRVSGERFELLGTGEPAPLGLNGVWRMVTVDIGNPVTVGETTAEIPEVTISGGEESGMISGNFGCNEYSVDFTFVDDVLTGQPETLEGTEEFCEIPAGSGELALTEQSLLELLAGGPARVFLQGDDLEIGTEQTNAVFERIAG